MPAEVINLGHWTWTESLQVAILIGNTTPEDLSCTGPTLSPTIDAVLSVYLELAEIQGDGALVVAE